MSKWKEIELGEVADVQTGPFGSQLKNEQYIAGGTPVVTVEHIQDFRIIDFDYPSITDEDKDRLSKYLMKEGDILFTRVGSVDLSAYVSKGQDGWMFSSRMLRVRPNQEISSRFLSYFFQQKSFRDYIINIAVGATMPSINTGILKTIPISYPPLDEQNAIAEVLSSLDDKIDLLHRENQTLEQMAETLFRQWFVEAIQKIEYEGDSVEGFQLDKFTKWIEGTLGGEWGKENQQGDYIKPVYCIRGTDIADLNVGLPLKIPQRYVKENKFEKIKPEEGDLIIEISGGTETQSTGRVTYINADVKNLFDLPLVFSNFSRMIKVKKTEYSFFMYCYIQYLYNQDEFFNLENGSSGIKNLDYKALLLELDYPMPEEELVLKFYEAVQPFFKKVNENKSQIRTLTALRDTLLPKLMSGEVRVQEKLKTPAYE